MVLREGKGAAVVHLHAKGDGLVKGEVIEVSQTEGAEDGEGEVDRLMFAMTFSKVDVKGVVLVDFFMKKVMG